MVFTFADPDNEHTATSLDGLCVVVGDVVVDPGQVSIGLFGRVGSLKILQSTANHTVAEQARKESNLQRKPVL